MDNHGIAGTLKIQCKSKKIAIDVKPNRKSVNLSDLSGGEKSKTLSFFIHSLWKHLSCLVPNQYTGNTQGLPGVMPPSVVVQGNVRFFSPGRVKK